MNDFKMRILGASLVLITTIGCSDNVAFDKIVSDIKDPGGVCQENCDGGGALYAVEDFEQKERNSKVDILFVVDNSPSMYQEQKKLGARFSSFISALSTVDWQIGFTTTDASNGTYGIKGSLLDLNGRAGEKILTPDTPNASHVFSQTVQRKESNCSFVCPTSDEQGLLATIFSMEKSLTENKEFFRDNTDIVVVYISDEDELSTGPREATKPKDVLDTFHGLWGQTKSFAAYGIIIEPNDLDCLKENRDQGTTAYYGTHVSQLAALTGGITGSLCQADYSRTLEEISNRVRELVDSFELKSVPVGDVKVELVPVQPSIRWRLEGNKLIFSKPPQSGTKIRVTYQKS